MNTFFIEFRDPLFSIIIFFTIIFVITFFSYWWNKYKRKEDSKYLDKFLQQFRVLPSHNELQKLIVKGGMSEKSWLLLAHSYFKNGDYEKSIEIYNEILKLSDSSNSKETLFLLGKTYYKAGFLERSKEIFLKILKIHPRTPQALHYLLLVYEQLHDYASALEVLEPLNELNEDVSTEKAYLELLQILCSTMAQSEKVQRLITHYKTYHKLPHLVFENLFRLEPKLAWENFDSSKSGLLADILWSVNGKNLNLDIISKNGYLRELYTARGDVTLVSGSSLFEFDVLIKLEKKAAATLSFEYICDSCKMCYPFAFNRCAACHSIDTLRVERNLIKDYYKDFSEENNSFQ